MKIFLLTVIFWGSWVTAMYAQNAAHYYNTGKSLSDKATELLGKMTVFNKSTNGKIISLYKESADNYLKAKGAMPALKSRANYCAAVDLYKAAVQYRAASEDEKSYDVMKQVLNLWPTLTSIRSSVIIKQKSVTKKGYIYIFPAADSMQGYLTNYYMSRYLLCVLSEKLNMPDSALKYAEEAADHFKTAPDIASPLAWYAAAALHKQGNTCDAGRYAIIYLENIAQQILKEKETGMAANNKKLIEMERYVVAADSQGCIKNNKAVECVAIIANLKAPWKPNAPMIYDLGENLYIKGSHSFQLIFSEYKLSMGEGDSTVAHIWDVRLNNNRLHYSSSDWITLSAFYGNNPSKTNLRDNAIKNAQRREKQEDTKILVGIEPTVAPLGQYAASIQLMGKYVCHEIRVGYIANGIKPYLKGGGDTESVPLYLLSHYSGLQLSYSFKILSKGEFNPNAMTYLGAEFRYTLRNYTDPLTYYNQNDTTEHFNNVNLKPKATVYDATLLFGEIIKGKKLFFELFGGVGIGYKTITYSNPAFNSKIDAVANAPFKADIWNKLYIPVRFGIKIGLVLPS